MRMSRTGSVIETRLAECWKCSLRDVVSQPSKTGKLFQGTRLRSKSFGEASCEQMTTDARPSGISRRRAFYSQGWALQRDSQFTSSLPSPPSREPPSVSLWFKLISHEGSEGYEVILIQPPVPIVVVRDEKAGQTNAPGGRVPPQGTAANANHLRPPRPQSGRGNQAAEAAVSIVLFPARWAPVKNTLAYASGQRLWRGPSPRGALRHPSPR